MRSGGDTTLEMDITAHLKQVSVAFSMCNTPLQIVDSERLPAQLLHSDLMGARIIIRPRDVHIACRDFAIHLRLRSHEEE